MYFIWKPKLQNRLPINGGLGLEPRKCGSLVQALKYLTKLALPNEDWTAHVADRTLIKLCFLVIGHLRKSKGAFSLYFSWKRGLGFVPSGLHTLQSGRELRNFHSPKSRPLMLQGWIVSRCFSELREPNTKVGGWAVPGPETVRGLHQGGRDSNTAGCMHPWRDWRLHATHGNPSQDNSPVLAQGRQRACLQGKGVVRAVVQSPGSPAGTPPQFF